MTTIEVLMLVQTLILFGTGAVVAFYTLETRRMRVVASAQFDVMQQAFGLQLLEQKRAAEPIFVWGGGSASGDHVEWEFTNEGGPISHVTITMRSPSGAQSGVQPDISPSDWLGASRKGIVTFRGNVAGELPFTIGFRTQIGTVGSFFFTASRASRPIFTGSGWFE